MAAIGGLGALKRRCAVKLYTDSKYVLQGHHRMAAELEGARLAHRGARARQESGSVAAAGRSPSQAQDMEWHWVKGHSGHEGNEYVDQLANVAIDRCWRRGRT